jgi:transposase InsO family protein
MADAWRSLTQALRLTPDKRLSTVVRLNGVGPGGLAIHKDGRIFIAAMNMVRGTGLIVAVKPDGTGMQTIVPATAGYMPNDLVFDAHGGLYFSDFRGISTEPKGGAYYASADVKTITPVLPHLAMANGIALRHKREGSILRRHGIEPAPERSRKTTWKELLIVAADFFTIEVWTASGLKRFLVLFFLDLSSRRVEITGVASGANGLWMHQIGRNVTDAVDGILNGKRYLIHDRDPLFTTEFQNILASVGVTSVKLPPQSPNLNAYAERFVRSIKESCLDRLILFGEKSLRRAIRDFILHYHEERNHQGKGNQLLFPRAVLSNGPPHGNVCCQQRLGGLLKYYHREAA